MDTENKSLVLNTRDLIETNRLNDLDKLLKTYPQIIESNIYSDFYKLPILYHAALHGNLEICKLLVKRGAGINDTIEGVVSLNGAAKKGHLEVAKWLVENGANIDGDKDSVVTPLMTAIMFGYVELAKYLIEKGANINAVHLTQYRTPLDYARTWGVSEIEGILTKKGALSMAKPIEWKNEFGGALLKYVNDNAGPVLPIKLTSIVESKRKIELRIAQVNKKKQKYIFTVGAYALHKPMLELSIVVAEDWNLNDMSAKNFFPCQLLLDMTDLLSKGHDIKEGDYISPEDNLPDLEWPVDIAGFWICDYSWKKDKQKETEKPKEKSDNTVTFFTLIPVKKTKSNKKVAYDTEKMRYESWGKITLKL